MGRRKPGKQRRERTETPAVEDIWWGEPLTPNPITGRFELQPTAPPDTVEFFRQMEELVPLYGGSVPESAAQLDAVARRGTELGILGWPGIPAGRGFTVTVGELAAQAGISVDELRLHLHHMHASGILAVTQDGLLRFREGAVPPGLRVGKSG